MAAVKLTCFADEISHDLEEQLDVLQQEGLRHIEVRGVWGKNVLDLTGEELRQIRAMTKERGFGISSIASPIGKYALQDDFAPQIESLHRAIAAAHALETPYIRVFSYYLPENASLDDCRDEVLSRMKQLADIAAQHHVTLILENDDHLYGAKDDRCLDILQHCASDSLRLALDPGNFVINGVKPMTDAYPKLQSYAAYIHVKDATAEPRRFVPAGEGDGQIDRLLPALREREYAGFLSVEPHLHDYMPHASNPKRVVTAVRALKRLLEQADMAWE
ncbi:sugar phosphate isomerase/epimerase [Paenibacillus rhizovicinus]|uniref:Sugar phosphate isomerase/epimerase n=1 Tax=Paenibacillus rhizovicinus TaxID=2704463 RepID=A0A6C0NWF6_9BACL|nr:sugar phosphate isomerase/epimerase family protein [Paenibacillus rhizovicinus]QHW30537.1 sugar phosphate isomerase/epimerase [Paenibacillus rhizovicinus]